MQLDKLKLEDLAAMIEGANSVLALMARIFPDVAADELLEKMQQLEQSPVARELLHQRLTQDRLKPERMAG